MAVFIVTRKMAAIRLLLALITVVGSGLCLDFPNNTEVCNSMTPSSNVGPQTKPPPFKISVNKDSYKGGDTLKINLASMGQEMIIGFMISARLLLQDNGISFGNPRTSEVSTVSICNSRYGSSLIHENSGSFVPKQSINFDWTALTSTKGHLVFKVSVIYSADRFWVAEPSQVIMDQSSPALPKIPGPSPPPTSESISMSHCGKTRGCYRNPPGCDESDCDALVTWSDAGDVVEFQMTGDTEGWISVALSEDTKPGKDEVFECLWNDTAKQVEIRHLRSREDGKSYVLIANPFSLKNKDGRLSERRLTCSFKKDKAAMYGQNNQFLSERRYLLLSKGRVDKNGKKIIHEQEANKYPYVSPVPIKLSDKFDLSDTIRYPLVKAHGCLMVIGWMICFMTGLLLSKYYRPMWPNSRWCGARIWYSGYMLCVVLCAVFTIIGFILIFIHASGLVELPIYPDKAHPPIGICTTVLIILIPLFALCRPTEPNKQNAFGICINWFLWLFETAASILATVNIFIGLNLPKAHVPWWTTWVVVAFFLFHLIVELMLEIHGCLNSMKNEVRRQQYENERKGSPGEPEPVGKRFKQRTLTIYLFVSIILGFVIVISIAAG